MSCTFNIPMHKVIKKFVLPFFIEKKEACFFAYYVRNPMPTQGPSGNGNRYDAIWYAYYFIDNPTKIFYFPKPKDFLWTDICTLNYVSFLDMNGDRLPDVTIIGSCNRQNFINYEFPLVFIRNKKNFRLHLKSYLYLHGFVGLSIPNIKGYLASPKKVFSILSSK